MTENFLKETIFNNNDPACASGEEISKAPSASRSSLLAAGLLLGLLLVGMSAPVGA